MKRTIKRRTEITIETRQIKTIHIGRAAVSRTDDPHEKSIVELRPLVPCGAVPESPFVPSEIEDSEEPKS